MKSRIALATLILAAFFQPRPAEAEDFDTWWWLFLAHAVVPGEFVSLYCWVVPDADQTYNEHIDEFMLEGIDCGFEWPPSESGEYQLTQQLSPSWIIPPPQNLYIGITLPGPYSCPGQFSIAGMGVVQWRVPPSPPAYRFGWDLYEPDPFNCGWGN